MLERGDVGGIGTIGGSVSIGATGIAGAGRYRHPAPVHR